MRKHLLMATVATLFVSPALATEYSARTGSAETAHAGYKVRMTDSTRVERLEDVQNAKFSLDGSRPGTFATRENKTLVVKNGLVYVLRDNGSSYIAPNGPYTTEGGLTFYAEDGRILRVESPEEIAYIDMNGNGRFDAGRDTIR
ncbi:MAG: hypothetical protein K9G62_05570 [Alphaproteobacteria bacterium]|nr:hypothetical protein [Alphaproteobacteria bacterium]